MSWKTSEQDAVKCISWNNNIFQLKNVKTSNPALDARNNRKYNATVGVIWSRIDVRLPHISSEVAHEVNIMIERKIPWVFVVAGAIFCPVLFFLGAGGLFLVEGNLDSTWERIGLALAPVGVITSVFFVGTLALSLILWSNRRSRGVSVLLLKTMTLLIIVLVCVLAISLKLSGTI